MPQGQIVAASLRSAKVKMPVLPNKWVLTTVLDCLAAPALQLASAGRLATLRCDNRRGCFNNGRPPQASCCQCFTSSSQTLPYSGTHLANALAAYRFRTNEVAAIDASVGFQGRVCSGIHHCDVRRRLRNCRLPSSSSRSINGRLATHSRRLGARQPMASLPEPARKRGASSISTF